MVGQEKVKNRSRNQCSRRSLTEDNLYAFQELIDYYHQLSVEEIN